VYFIYTITHNKNVTVKPSDLLSSLIITRTGLTKGWCYL